MKKVLKYALMVGVFVYFLWAIITMTPLFKPYLASGYGFLPSIAFLLTFLSGCALILETIYYLLKDEIKKPSKNDKKRLIAWLNGGGWKKCLSDFEMTRLTNSRFWPAEELRSEVMTLRMKDLGGIYNWQFEIVDLNVVPDNPNYLYAIVDEGRMMLVMTRDEERFGLYEKETCAK